MRTWLRSKLAGTLVTLIAVATPTGLFVDKMFEQDVPVIANLSQYIDEENKNLRERLERLKKEKDETDSISSELFEEKRQLENKLEELRGKVSQRETELKQKNENLSETLNQLQEEKSKADEERTGLESELKEIEKKDSEVKTKRKRRSRRNGEGGASDEDVFEGMVEGIINVGHAYKEAHHKVLKLMAENRWLQQKLDNFEMYNVFIADSGCLSVSIGSENTGYSCHDRQVSDEKGNLRKVSFMVWAGKNAHVIDNMIKKLGSTPGKK